MSPHKDNVERFRDTWKRVFDEDISLEAAEIELRDLACFLEWLHNPSKPKLSTARDLTDRTKKSINEEMAH